MRPCSLGGIWAAQAPTRVAPPPCRHHGRSVVSVALRQTGAMTDPIPQHTPEAFQEAPLEVLEDDETIPPRPEEELADVERSERDPR